MKTTEERITNYRTIKILGVDVDFINLKNALSLVEKWLDTDKQYQISTPNPEHIIICQSDYRFKNIINKSALRIADGAGLVWAGKLLNGRSTTNLIRFSKRARKDQVYSCGHRRDANLRKHSQIHCFRDLSRLAGMDLMLGLCKLASQKKLRVFLLGGKNFAAAKAAQNLVAISKRSLDLNVNYDSGPANINKETKLENKALINKINQFKPHLLFVAFGAPMQEKWIANNFPKLKVKVAMGVGGSFDYLAGFIKRAPALVRKLGLEWLWRLVYEPRRWRRQLRLVKFVYLVIKEKLT